MKEQILLWKKKIEIIDIKLFIEKMEKCFIQKYNRNFLNIFVNRFIIFLIRQLNDFGDYIEFELVGH